LTVVRACHAIAVDGFPHDRRRKGAANRAGFGVGRRGASLPPAGTGPTRHTEIRSRSAHARWTVASPRPTNAADQAQARLFDDILQREISELEELVPDGLRDRFPAM
jgi:hypothetical protein